MIALYIYLAFSYIAILSALISDNDREPGKYSVSSYCLVFALSPIVLPAIFGCIISDSSK